MEIRPPRSASPAWTLTGIKRSWPARVDTVAVDVQQGKVLNRARFSDYPLMAKLTRRGIDAHIGILFALILSGAGLCLLIACGYRTWRLRCLPAPAHSPLNTVRACWLLLFMIIDALRWQRVQS